MRRMFALFALALGFLTPSLEAQARQKPYSWSRSPYQMQAYAQTRALARIQSRLSRWASVRPRSGYVSFQP